jgi:hypothetical protein
MREQEIFGWNWGGEHKEAYLDFGAIICPITEVLLFPSHSCHRIEQLSCCVLQKKRSLFAFHEFGWK